jgi:hypothetical protein
MAAAAAVAAGSGRCRAGGRPVAAMNTSSAMLPTPGLNRRSSIPLRGPTPTLIYKGFSIIPRTFQLRGSERWTLDLLIGGRGGLRAFSGPATYRSERAAVLGCHRLAQRIIDGRAGNRTADDLC